MANIEVVNPGLLTTVQDRGRSGHAHQGYPECGAMDSLSLEMANCLVGNAGNAAVLECTALGPALRIHGRVLAASPDARLSLNGQPQLPGVPLHLRDGDLLEMKEMKGFRACLAFSGGIQVPPVLGSRSTDLKSQIGGLEGRRLKIGDRFETGNVGPLNAFFLRLRARFAHLPEHPFKGWNGEPFTIHVTPGPQADRFSEAGRRTFLSGTYTITVDSNRMGLRLEGPPIESIGGTDILSDGILCGSIQVPSGGRPVILTADHQTTGGYAKLAVVVPTDLPVLAQLRPGMQIRFEQITEAEALQAYKARSESLRRLRKEMGIWKESI